MGRGEVAGDLQVTAPLVRGDQASVHTFGQLQVSFQTLEASVALAAVRRCLSAFHVFLLSL
jgi:hypothetical protein